MTGLELAFLDDTFLYIIRKAACDHDKQDAVYQTEEGTEMVAVNPVKLAFLSVIFNKVRQGGETWQNIKA